MYQWGFMGAVAHMVEILPLVALLVGLVKLPSIPGSILIAVSEPLTCAPKPQTDAQHLMILGRQAPPSGPSLSRSCVP